MRIVKLLAGLLSAAVIGLSASVAVADVNFSGKKVTMIVPFKEGGGTDAYVRLFSTFFSKNLPGKPTIVVLNKPGGASVRAANEFQKTKPDGLTVMGCSTSTLTNFVLGGKDKIRYDVLSWVPIVLNARGTAIYAVPDQTGVTGKDIRKDIAALRKAKTIFGAKNKTSAELRALLAFDMLGFFPKTVFGLSTGKQRKATLRGELNLNYDSAAKYVRKVAKWEKKGKIKLFMSLGLLTPDGKVVRDPVLPDTPTIVDAYEAMYGKKPSGQQFEVLKSFIAMGVSASKSLVLPPGTSTAIRDAYISAAKKAFTDPKFMKAMNKKMGKYPPNYGKDAAAVLKAATAMSPGNKKWMKLWIEKKFGKSS
jgi:tripartite-type tricarboxylate transporter receptor subunit TctC